MSPTTEERIIAASGLMPGLVRVLGAVAYESPERPAILRVGAVGDRWNALHGVIKAWQIEQDDTIEWAAIAFISPNLVLLHLQLSYEDEERLRHANLDVPTPEGSKPASEVTEAPGADEDIAAGRVAQFDTAEDFIADLDEDEGSVVPEPPEDLPEELRGKVREGWG